jgi:hypothetical protein
LLIEKNGPRFFSVTERKIPGKPPNFSLIKNNQPFPGISLKINEQRIAFVNCHLAPHEGEKNANIRAQVT